METGSERLCWVWSLCWALAITCIGHRWNPALVKRLHPFSRWT